MRRIVFGLLGTLDVRVDGRRIALGGARQRTVLTTLLLAPDRVVSVDGLIDAVWHGTPPTTARNQIAICVGALRTIFKDAAGVDDLIVTSHPGYLLSAGEHRLDAREFEDLAGRARPARRAAAAAPSTATAISTAAAMTSGPAPRATLKPSGAAPRATSQRANSGATPRPSRAPQTEAASETTTASPSTSDRI
ncbi:winged helix-turn-helix domain-containing protein [Streptomyces sp. MAG02]|nr:winged helix-turn-helix domain-containing protein [Streptomyces sp. MAG02]